MNSPSGEVRAILGRGHTGRSVAVDEYYRRAERWSQSGTKRRLLRDSASDLFRASLQATESVRGPLVCFRGRVDDGTVQSWRNMGPPAALRAREGRYNSVGRPALYLCDSEEGVRRELGLTAAFRAAFLQEYRVDTQLTRIADLAVPTLGEFA